MPGATIVLTSDRTLMSNYHNHLFLGFAATIPKGKLPDWIYYNILCPPVEANPDGSAKFAPYGCRKVEAALLSSGFSREEVVVAHPDHIEELVGPDTKIVGFTENDPLGIGPATSTFREIMGGISHMEFNLIHAIRRVRRRSRAKIVVGGPGSWQLADEETLDRLGVDYVVLGEGEKDVPLLFRRIIRGDSLPRIIHGEHLLPEEIPPILGPSVAGLVEVARGCGRGCRFCIPAMRKLRMIPLRQIAHEVRLNLNAGKQPILHAEDVLAYGSRGSRLNAPAVKKLFQTVLDIPGVFELSVSHFSVSSIVQARSLLGEINELIWRAKEDEGRTPPTRPLFYMSGQIGIETASPRLMKQMMPGKVKPYRPEDWPSMVKECFDLLAEYRWLPCATLILGLPGETDRDVEMTIDLVDELATHVGLLIPLFYVDIQNRGRNSFRLHDVTPLHGELFMKCWRHTLRSVPKMLQRQMLDRLSTRISRIGVQLLVQLGMHLGLRAAELCEKHYGWDLRQMVQDLRTGRRKLLPPQPILHIPDVLAKVTRR